MIDHVVRGVSRIRRFLGADPGRDPSTELEELMSVGGEAQAHVIHGRLETRGIPAMIRRRTPISTFTWQMSISNRYEIWVRRGDLKRARSLIEADAS